MWVYHKINTTVLHMKSAVLWPSMSTEAVSCPQRRGHREWMEAQVRQCLVQTHASGLGLVGGEATWDGSSPAISLHLRGIVAGLQSQRLWEASQRPPAPHWSACFGCSLWRTSWRVMLQPWKCLYILNKERKRGTLCCNPGKRANILLKNNHLQYEIWLGMWKCHQTYMSML